MKEEELKTVRSAKYLGVTVASDLSWNEHVANTLAKANRALGFVQRNVVTPSTGKIEKREEILQILKYQVGTLYANISFLFHCEKKMNYKAYPIAERVIPRQCKRSDTRERICGPNSGFGLYHHVASLDISSGTAWRMICE